MAYQVLDTQLLQSAIKAAASVTSAMVAAGVDEVKDDPAGYMDTLADDLFAKLKKQADEDNAKLREEAEKNPPRKQGGNWSPSKRKPGGNVESDGSLVFTWGAFKGKTIAEVFELTEDEAADYGYKGDGRRYIDWVSQNDKNGFAADRAKAFLDEKRK